jgi:DNA-binding GntR family transcriptional regulator
MPAPTYQRIADDLRRAILDGTLVPGAKLPSRHELARQYEVSDRVGVEAVRLLVAEGFAETRSGSGSYVRRRPEMQRLTRSWYTTRRGGSPFRAEMGAAGRAGAWECASERAPLTPAVAQRLGAEPGEPAMRTRYTFTADGEPVMLSVSWEPLGLTEGTPVMFPEEGPHAGRGVVERMAVIGQQITSAEEVVSARPALATEADRLAIRPGGTVITISRTYHTDARPVEAADIVIPVERYSLVYEIPVELGPGNARAAGARCVVQDLMRRVSKGGPGPADRSRAREQVIERVAGPSAEKIEDPSAHGRRFRADDPAGQGGQRSCSADDGVHASRITGVTDELPTAAVDDRLPGVQRPRARRRPFAAVPGSDAHVWRAQRQNRGQRLGRGRECPSVVGGQALDEGRVVDFSGVVRVIPVQPRVARIGRVSIGET